MYREDVPRRAKLLAVAKTSKLQFLVLTLETSLAITVRVSAELSCHPLGTHGSPLAYQVADLVKVFDDRVKEMCELRVQVQMFIASQVWYTHRPE